MSKPATTGTRRLAAVRSSTAIGVALLLLVLALMALTGTAFSAGANGVEPSRSAHAARTLSAADTAHLHYIRSSGSLLYEEGSASGTLPGSMRVHIDFGPTVSASFTLYTHGGTIDGRGSATAHGSGTYESFAGTITATGGSGRYAHAGGHAGFYGTFDRKNYSLVIQTTGRLSF